MAKQIRITIDTDEIDHFIAQLKIRTKTFSSFINDLGESAGEIISQSVLEAIRNQMSTAEIGQFMVDRTKVQVVTSGGDIFVSVSGMTEGEAGNPERPSGGRPQVSSPNVNLWNTHEYGNRFGRGSPYVGEIRGIVSGLSGQLEKALRAYVGVNAYDYIATSVETASKGKIQLPKGTIAAMQMAGVSPSDLAALGASNIVIDGRGRILLFGPSATGAAGRFVSHKGLVPTTI